MVEPYSEDQSPQFERPDNSDAERPFPDRLPVGNLLSQILHLTDINGEEPGATPSESLRDIEQSLLQVVRRHGADQPLSAEIVQDLVLAITSRVRGMSAPLSAGLVDWVTQTFLTDPLSRTRLEHFWGELKGRDSDGN